MEDLFTQPIPDYGTQFSCREFREAVEAEHITDYDGFGHPIRGGNMNPYVDIPADASAIPANADGVVWLPR